MSDPKRLLEDPHADPLGRALLGSTIVPVPTGDQIETLWGALTTGLPTIGVPRAPPIEVGTSSTPGKAAGGGASAKVTSLLGILGASAVGIGVAVFGGGRSNPSLEATARSTAALPSAEAVPPSVAARPPDPEPAVADAIERAAPALTRRRSRAGALPSEARLRAEIEVVLRGRALLRAGACVGALEALGSGTPFANGGLAEEREALAIEALACVGRDVEAANRAAAFLRQYPRSPHVAAMRRFIR